MDGDAQFVGVNQLTQPGDLQPGEVRDAKNARFTYGRSEPRLGVTKLPWTNRVASSPTTAQPFSSVQGAGVFRDPDDREWVIIAAEGKVFRTLENGGTAEIMLPPGVVITGDVTFTQAFNGLLLFREADTELIMDDIDTGFTPVSMESNTISGAGTENPSSGTEAIPDAAISGEWIGNRMFIPYTTATEKDLLAISDYLNATRYAPIRSAARINQGSSDVLERFFKFSDTKGIAFKTGSIYGLYGLQGDLSDMYLDAISTEFGTTSPRGIVQVGRGDGDNAPSQVWFISEQRGVCVIFEGEQGRLQVGAIPVSQEIQRTIARIDWRNADNIRAAQWDAKVYFAVPLDDSRNNSPEIIRSLSYSGGSKIVGVIPGATYLWTKGANDTSLSNAGVSITDTSEFTATSAEVTLFGSGSSSITASLVRVFTSTNNAILVYDLRRQKWAGHDTGTAMMVKEFFKTTYLGARRLFFVSEDGFINLVEETYDEDGAYEVLGANLYSGVDITGTADNAVTVGQLYVYNVTAAETLLNGATLITGPATGVLRAVATPLRWTDTPSSNTGGVLRLLTYTLLPEWIDHDVTYRGLRCGFDGWKRFVTGRINVMTWYPSFTISAVLDGQLDEKTLKEDVTKSRTEYYKPFNKADWDETNVDDDHATAHRRDYSVVLGETTTPSGSIAAGILYYVESSDVTSACQITYNSVAYTNGQTFTGVAGVTTFTVNSGTPLVYGPGNYVLAGANGIEPDRHQETEEPFRVGAFGREVMLRVRNTQGRCIVTGTRIEARARDGSMTVKE